MAQLNQQRVSYDPLLTGIVNYVYDFNPQSLCANSAFTNARLALLDALGCASETTATSQSAFKVIDALTAGSNVPKGFCLPYTARQLDPVRGAFALGVQIRYLDHNDAMTGAEWGHPSDTLAPILASADWVSRQGDFTESHSGITLPVRLQTILHLLIKAYEVQCIIQQQTSFNSVGLDHVLLVKVASTAVTSLIFGLNRDQALSALSHAFMDGHPLRTYRHSPNTGPRKGWAAARASSQAVELVLLAKAGQAGAPSALSAPRWGFTDVVLRGKEIALVQPFRDWAIHNILYKMAPAEGHGLTAIEAAELLSQKLIAQGLSLEKDVDHVVVQTHAAAKLIIDKKTELQNPADRDHDLRYMVAVTLTKGKAPVAEDFTDSSIWAGDKTVANLRQTMVIVENSRFTSEYLDIDEKSLPNGVDLVLKNGMRLGEEVIRHPRGSSKRVRTFDDVRAKAFRNFCLVFEADKAAAVLSCIMEGEQDIYATELTDLLWKG